MTADEYDSFDRILMATSDGGSRAQGETPGLFVLALFLLATIFAFAVDVSAAEVSNTAEPTSWSQYFPYAPAKNEYQAEIGAFWEKENMHWLGLTYGRHLGRCFFVETQNCQQFVEFTGGGAHTEGTTFGIYFVSLRWQWVSFPKPFSPSARVLVGAESIRDERRDVVKPIYGIGLGWTATLHERLDVKPEIRFGGGDREWTTVLISFSLKIDKWIDYYSEKMLEILGRQR